MIYIYIIRGFHQKVSCDLLKGDDVWLVQHTMFHEQQSNSLFVTVLIGKLVFVWTSGYHVPALIIVSGRSTGLMSEPLMAPPQLKPSPPLLHKEPPILIKQASLDKNKGGKKDKVWKALLYYVLILIVLSFTLYRICSGTYFNTCTVHLLLFCTMTNKCTINWQIITLLRASKKTASTYKLYIQPPHRRTSL